MSVHYEDDTVRLLCGDALAEAKTLSDSSVQTIVTSPPYFGLRDYGKTGQMGAEDSVDAYVEAMVALFRELARALTDDGTLWLNLGDSYSSEGGKQGVGVNARVGNTLKQKDSRTRPTSDLPSKNLLGVPWRVALALQADGWILRSDIIWAKPNPMPESVTDRPTKAHEYLFLFAKSAKYFYDSAAISEEAVEGDRGSKFDTGKTAEHQMGRAQKGPRFGGSKYGDLTDEAARTYSGNEYTANGRRNKRTVWTVGSQPFPGAHFAVYPPELIRPCILAGSRPGDVVLDPFSGSGTTGMVATQEGRRYVGIDLNPEYLDLSLRTRFVQPALNLGAAS